MAFQSVDASHALKESRPIAILGRGSVIDRGWGPAAPSPTVGTCPFCPDVAADRFERVLGTVAAFRDGFPVSEGHLLIVPLRHTESFLTMTDDERRDADLLLVELASDLTRRDPSIEGFNIGMNCGETAGQTVEHAHTHLIPRRTGDTPAPRGGVRGVIPSRMNY